MNNKPMSLRFDGHLVADQYDSPLIWTVIDQASPYYRYTLSREALLGLGYMEHELQRAVNYYVTTKVFGNKTEVLL